MSSKPNFFIIDEGWSCMDKENLGNVSVVMKFMKELYDHVIIISHLDELKEQADYALTIEKNKQNFSHINNASITTRPVRTRTQNHQGKKKTMRIIEV